MQPGLARRSGLPPLLGVLRRHRADPFLMSPAVDGYSLALEFKVTERNGQRLWALAAEFDELLLGARGRLYFAKDCTATAATVRHAYGEEWIERFLRSGGFATPRTSQTYFGSSAGSDDAGRRESGRSSWWSHPSCSRLQRGYFDYWAWRPHRPATHSPGSQAWYRCSSPHGGAMARLLPCFSGSPFESSRPYGRAAARASRDQIARTFRVFGVGESSAAGFRCGTGYAFSSWLERHLTAEPLDCYVEVVNAAMPGYSSRRQLVVLRELAAYSPDLLLVHNGHNELAERRFYAQLLDRDPRIFHRQELLVETRLYRLASTLLSAPRARPSVPEFTEAGHPQCALT